MTSLNDPSSSLLRLAHGAAAAGLVFSSCGNASVLGHQDHFLITASGTQLAEITAAGIAEVSLDGHHHSGPVPSIEVLMHQFAFQVRPEINAVLHCHAQWATLMACLQEPERDLDFITEIPAYVGQHAYVPYLTPGSEALARAVAQELIDPRVTVVQLSNHGQVAVGATWEEALRRLVFFERACWMALQPHPLRRISIPRVSYEQSANC